MAIRYGYFNSVDGDRKYNAEDMTMYFKGLVSDGVYQTVGNMLVINAGSGLTVTMGTGRALVNMHWIENTAIMNIDLGTASVSADTYKLIVLRCDLSDNVRNISVVVKDSADGSVVLTNDETITELCLARVRIRKNASTISQSDIRDYRGSSYCPWITGLIKQADVSQLNEQFYTYYEEQTADLEKYMNQQKTSFDNWLSSLQSELTVNTKIKSYQSTFTTTKNNTTEIPLISNYEAGDVLLIHIGGVMFVEGTEFTIDSQNQKVILTNPVDYDNLITQILLKSTIGDGSSGGTSGITATKIESGTDLNTVKTTGLYYVDEDVVTTNKPDGVNYQYTLLVIAGNGFLTQFLMNNGAGHGRNIYLRTADPLDDSIEWYEWQSFMDDSYLPKRVSNKLITNSNIINTSKLSVKGEILSGFASIQGTFTLKTGAEMTSGIVLATNPSSNLVPKQVVYGKILCAEGDAGIVKINGESTSEWRNVTLVKWNNIESEEYYIDLVYSANV